MNLKFTSNILQNNQKFKVVFETKITISKYQHFTVYEFIDPKTNAQNRIEIDKDKVNIFVGPSSMNLVLHKWIDTSYKTPQGIVMLSSYLINLKTQGNYVRFKYKLNHESNLIGEYDLELVINKEINNDK